jgi:TPR repeat protein
MITNYHIKSTSSIITIVLSLCLSFNVFADSDQDELIAAEKAYAKQDYKTAFKLYKELAASGSALAQGILGGMYYDIWGVKQDFQEAVKWYREAADQGQLDAQLLLGRMYYFGRGIPQSYVQALMWDILSNSNNHPSLQQDTVNHAAEKMSPQQIEEAQRLAREWKPKKNDYQRGVYAYCDIHYRHAVPVMCWLY